MSPKWIILIVMVWVVLALLGGVIEGAYLGGGEESTLNVLVNYPVYMGEVLASGNPISAVAAFFDMPFWGALGTMLMFDFAMFEGSMAIFKWVFFMPLAAGVLLSLALATFRGVGSG